MKKQTTKKMIEIWDMFDQVTIRDLRPPTIRELMDDLKVKSTSLVSYRLWRGVEVGLVCTYYDRWGRMHYAPAWWSRMVLENIERYHPK